MTVDARPKNAIHATNGYPYNSATDTFAGHGHVQPDLGAGGDQASATGTRYRTAAADEDAYKVYRTEQQHQSSPNNNVKHVDFGVASGDFLSHRTDNTFSISSAPTSNDHQHQYTDNNSANIAIVGTTIIPAEDSNSRSIVNTGTFSTAGNRKTQSANALTTTVGLTKARTSLVQPSQLPPIITKSFYFEAAPEEPEEQQAPRFVSIGRAQKNYKVIFIKAPSYGLNSQIIPVLPQNEDKTIIYVLSKKPEFNQDIELPPVPTTEPTKPEIFFIKYKSDQEAVDAQHKIKHVYETEQSALDASDVRFEETDRRIQTIVSEAVPNVFSASAPASMHEHVREFNVADGISSISSNAAVNIDLIEEQRKAHRLTPSGFTLLSTTSGQQSSEESAVATLTDVEGKLHLIDAADADDVNVQFIDINNAAVSSSGTAAAAEESAEIGEEHHQEHHHTIVSSSSDSGSASHGAAHNF